MTIRYECAECSSVLKIKDELAGTRGKCPKCKTAFVVPDADTDEDIPGIEIDTEAQHADEPEDDTDDLVDMPMDLTPDIEFSDEMMPGSGTDFDPMDVLSGSGTRPAAAAAPKERKPSVAELMKEFEDTKKKKADAKAHRSGKSGLEAAADAASEMVTSGSAADALSRTYTQKRTKAGEAPPATREERRAAEEREAMKRMVLIGSTSLVAVGILGYFFFGWLLSDPLPNLEYVSGVVRQEGKPVPGMIVMFAPINKAEDGALSGSSIGTTNENGEYVLMYDPSHSGAVLGEHQVELSNSEGVSFTIPEPDRRRTVSDSGDNVFDFNL